MHLADVVDFLVMETDRSQDRRMSSGQVDSSRSVGSLGMNLNCPPCYQISLPVFFSWIL